VSNASTIGEGAPKLPFFLITFQIKEDMSIVKSKTEYHIELEEAKRHLRIDSDFTDDNDYITQLIQIASEIAENYIESDIATTTTTIVLKDFASNSFIIGESNLISITSIIDSDTTEYTVDELRTFSDRFEVSLTSGVPTKDLTIIFESGYADTKLPAPLRQAILTKIADLYDNGRSGFNFSNTKYNPLFENILSFYKVKRFKIYPTE